MPQVTLTYDLDEDAGDLQAALCGRKAFSSLWDIDQRCRSILKHGEPSEETARLVEEIRQMIREACPEALEGNNW